MKRYSGKYIIRWTDQNGNKQRKVYDDYLTASKARKWLTDGGIADADIAVELQASSMFPIKKVESKNKPSRIYP